MSGAQPLASTSTHPPTVDVPALAFHIDILLLGLFVLYAVSTLPRALVRLFQPSEIFNGFFLRSSAQHTSPWRSTSTRALLRRDTLGRSDTVATSQGHANTEPVHNSTAGALAAVDEERNNTDGGFPALVTPVANRVRGTQPCYVPTRVPRWTTVVHPSLACALNYRVSSGISLGRILILMAYGIIVLYACLVGSNPFDDSNRWGYIAVSQIPIVVALANKSNWLSWVSGVGYEKVNINRSHHSPKSLHSEANPV